MRDAGFNKIHFKGLNEIIFLSEPVAAALYVLKALEEEDGERVLKVRSLSMMRRLELTSQVGECFVAADCGGGTVDVAAFRVTQTEPVTRLQEIGIGIGQSNTKS